MGWPTMFAKSWSPKSRLILGLAVLMVAMLIPVLCISFLPANSGASQEGAGETQSTEGVSNPSSTEGAGEGETLELIGVPWLTGAEIRDPEVAAQYGVPGYVEISLKDCPQELALGRDAEWTGTMLVHFVSYTPELTEVQVNVYPYGVSPWGEVGEGGGCYVGRYYEGGFFNFIDLITYRPSGAMVIIAGETLPIQVTVRIPADFPENIETVPLGAMGIWPDTPGVAFLDSITARVVIVR